MTDRETRTVSLPAEAVEYVDALVASGAYNSASEVVRAGLLALQERDATIDRRSLTQCVVTPIAPFRAGK